MYCLAERAEHAALKRLDQWQQDIRDGQTPDERAEYREQRADRTQDARHIVERHVEQYGAGDNAERGYPPVQVFFIPFEMPVHQSTPRFVLFIFYSSPFYASTKIL